MRVDRWVSGSQGTWATLGFIGVVLMISVAFFLVF